MSRRGSVPVVRVIKPVAAALVILALMPACGLFTLKEPYERWEIRMSYEDVGGRVTAEPDSFEVNGPRGEILVHNSTQRTRGFKIPELGVAAEIEDDESARLEVTAMQDGETYKFEDHLDRSGPRGEIVVDYVRRD